MPERMDARQIPSPQYIVIKLPPPVLLLALIAIGMSSCLGPSRTPKKGIASPGSNPETKTPPVQAPEPNNSFTSRDEYWSQAMKRYKPPAGMDNRPSVIDSPVQDALVTSDMPAPAQPEVNAPTPPPASTLPAPTEKPAPKQNIADIPFATRVEGMRGMVKSPFDPTGKPIDVRDFSPGQMVRCPYTKKIFRVPP